MAADVLLGRAESLWTGLADAPVAFRDGAFDVAVSPGSGLCPRGWAGVVRLGNAAIGTAPDASTAELLSRGFSLTTGLVVGSRVPTLGPATLAYCDPADFRPPDSGAVETLPAGHPDVVAFLAGAPADDVDESGLAEITSPAFVRRAGADVVAAAGYRVWPGGAGHLSVLTAPGARGRGLARDVAGTAVARVLDLGLLPQWRARPEASRRVARALGFRELGFQVSVRLSPGASRAAPCG
ncbi:GNAT family N-acetyltransferase [Cryptosporangium phraense]|uniref:GNAT family N-acetyltransferase n=1 Tax=Cryptosporangium phraense TaxID=2593070 RepID=A0A545AFV7_9ACTN|nr:GNAT family N-acetyltransferase [Cryptosporangium phraense]TQS40217.1 GNAT family N-acetyltransferase [Cryptosporangium phraense]